jgi:S1-C subfamily serine protease
MSLAETFESVRPSIVALGTRAAITHQGKTPLFPTILGTGFVVDDRGIVLTNRHVAEALQRVPRHPQTGKSSAFAIVHGQVEASDGGHSLGMNFVDINGYSVPHTFSFDGDFYGHPMPDLAFLQLNVRDVPALIIETEPNTLRIGLPIATAGFALGTTALVVYQRVNQITPLLRHGIVSSLYPFPCPSPHGFTVDIMTQGGESGSPIFLTDAPKVVGLLHAGFDNTNITMALPPSMLAQALSSCLAAADLDVTSVPSLESLQAQPGNHTKIDWELFPHAN